MQAGAYKTVLCLFEGEQQHAFRGRTIRSPLQTPPPQTKTTTNQYQQQQPSSQIWHRRATHRAFGGCGDDDYEEDLAWAARLDDGWDLSAVRAAAERAMARHNAGSPTPRVQWLDRGDEHPHRVALSVRVEVVAAVRAELEEFVGARVPSCPPGSGGANGSGSSNNGGNTSNGSTASSSSSSTSSANSSIYCGGQYYGSYAAGAGATGGAGPRGHVIASGAGGWRYLDVVAPRGGKLEAVEWVRSLYGIPSGRCMTAGDSFNDVEMFKGRSPAVIVGNAQVRAAACRDVCGCGGVMGMQSGGGRRCSVAAPI